MQNSGSGIIKLVISILAVICIILAVVFAVKNKPDCSGSTAPDTQPDDYSYQDDYSVSGGDITFDDNNTEEMDSIPNEDAPAASSSDS